MKEITATMTKGWQKYKKESWMRRKRKEREREGTQEGVWVGFLKGKTARWETKGKLGRGTCEGREKETGGGGGRKSAHGHNETGGVGTCQGRE